MLTVVSCEKDDPTPEVQATCDDGIQNGDETGIDCGGSCSVCEEPVTMAAPDLNVAPIDMEETGYGPDLDSSKESNASNPTGTWGVFGTDEANKMALSIVDNPNPTGNTSAHVLSIVEQAGQEPWQGFFFDLESKVAFSGTNTAISVDVHSVRAGQRVMLKLEDKTNASANTGEIIVATVGTGWETVVFNLSADYSGLFDRIVFIMDYGVVNDAVANHYMDNIRVSAPAVVEPPTVNTDGTFDAAMTGGFGNVAKEGDVYTFPASADTWGGWSNENSDMYPLGFPNGGTITFNASSSGADAGVYFRFERLPFDASDSSATEPSFNTATVTVSGETTKAYTIKIDAQAAENTYSSVLMYFTTRDVAVTITDIKINPGAEGETTTGTGPAGTYAPEYTGVFGGATKEGDVYTFPTGAETWAGFANENAAIYPLAFPNGGKITFTASSAGADVGVSFRFERLPHPDVDPAFNTAKATVSGTTATEYTIEIPAQDAANTFRSALMYLDTRDVGVTITNIEITVD